MYTSLTYYLVLVVLWYLVGIICICRVAYTDMGYVTLGDILVGTLVGIIGPFIYLIHLGERIRII